MLSNAYKLLNELVPFLAAEKVVAVIVPSRDGHDGGGTGIIFDDNGADSAAPLTTEIRQSHFL